MQMALKYAWRPPTANRCRSGVFLQRMESGRRASLRKELAGSILWYKRGLRPCAFQVQEKKRITECLKSFLRSSLCKARHHCSVKKNTNTQINGLYRPRGVCLRNDCRLVWKDVSRHYELSVSAYEKSSKCVSFMGWNWSLDFENIKRNLLQSTTMKN